MLAIFIEHTMDLRHIETWNIPDQPIKCLDLLTELKEDGKQNTPFEQMQSVVLLYNGILHLSE